MNWMMKVTIGMLLFATLFIALGVAVIRANEYRPQTTKMDVQKTQQKMTPNNVEKNTDLKEKVRPNK